LRCSGFCRRRGFGGLHLLSLNSCSFRLGRDTLFLCGPHCFGLCCNSLGLCRSGGFSLGGGPLFFGDARGFCGRNTSRFSLLLLGEWDGSDEVGVFCCCMMHQFIDRRIARLALRGVECAPDQEFFVSD